MELTPLRYFVAIARLGHMTRAARALGVTQPALSAAVRKLEREAGTPLLRRSARGVSLTAAGEAFLAPAHDAVRRAEAALGAVRAVLGLERGVIRVGAGATATGYLLPPVVSELRRRHPGLTFFIREEGSRAVAQAVTVGELDLGVLTLPLPPGLGGDEPLITPLVDDELRLIVPPRHRLSGSAAFRWKELAGESVVAFEAGSAVRQAIDDAGARAGVALHVAMELRSIESIKRMVAAGIGVGFVSRFALRPGEGLACKDGRIARKLAIARRRDAALSPAAEALARALVESVRPRA